jgi:hypothetical protein
LGPLCYAMLRYVRCSPPAPALGAAVLGAAALALLLAPRAQQTQPAAAAAAAARVLDDVALGDRLERVGADLPLDVLRSIAYGRRLRERDSYAMACSAVLRSACGRSVSCSCPCSPRVA